MPYRQLETKDDLALYFDDLTVMVRAMIGKTRSEGQTPEWIMQAMLKFIETNNLFLLVYEEEVGKAIAFIMGILFTDATPYVEILAMWAPRASTGFFDDAWDIFRAWARVRGAKRFKASIVRSPDVFYKFFYEPRGFRKIGYLVEADI